MKTQLRRTSFRVFVCFFVGFDFVLSAFVDDKISFRVLFVALLLSILCFLLLLMIRFVRTKITSGDGE